MLRSAISITPIAALNATAPNSRRNPLRTTKIEQTLCKAAEKET